MSHDSESNLLGYKGLYLLPCHYLFKRVKQHVAVLMTEECIFIIVK